MKASGKRTAVITGGTKGIGLGIAEHFCRSGLNVVITSRSRPDAEAVAQRLSSTFKECSVIGLPLDIEKKETFEPLLNESLRSFGRVDVLVNNAVSTATVLPLEGVSDEQVENAFTYGITNIFLLTKLVFSELKKNEGNVINIGSVAANRYVHGLPFYAINKGAIAQMTKVLAAEWAANKVRVNAIHPGFVYSEALSSQGMPESMVAKYYEYCRQYHPLGRVGKPEDVANLTVFLASEAASFITGAVIDCDAGYSVQGINMAPPGL